GDPNVDQCDNADTCDGNGACENNPVDDFTLCDDGDDCTEDDECLNRVCEGLTVLTCLWGDITSFLGLCVPACTGAGTDVDFDDVLCALDGFANAAVCPCADIKGPPEPTPCEPNGVIDFDDILTILNAFASNYDCPDPCPGPDPAPIMDPPGRDRSERQAPARIELVPSAKEIGVGDTVEVDVYIDGAVDLRAVQVALSVSGGDRGSLVLIEIIVDDGRSDFVFAGMDALTGIDTPGSRMGVAPVFGSVSPTASSYVGTFIFTAEPGSTGTFRIELREDTTTFLRDSMSQAIEVYGISATITVN
ncbi:MAG: hypothetical protein IIB61_04660, partial [Planctomycetes bacterium]|nr:hypothetical protein [Planctomycetota bacterium]